MSTTPAASVTAHQADQSASEPLSFEAFIARAVAMEVEATERYEELADAMEIHNNIEVSTLFRTMARVEQKHVEKLLAQWGAKPLPAAAPPAWDGARGEGPETAASDAIHYLMQPYHALAIALRNEERALQFFARIVDESPPGQVRDAALALRAEEQEHVELVKAWMARVPPPDPDWAVDPDPPRYTD